MLGLAVAFEDVGCQGDLARAADEDIQTGVKPDAEPVENCAPFKVVDQWVQSDGALFTAWIDGSRMSAQSQGGVSLLTFLLQVTSDRGLVEGRGSVS